MTKRRRRLPRREADPKGQAEKRKPNVWKWDCSTHGVLPSATIDIGRDSIEIKNEDRNVTRQGELMDFAISPFARR
jgi:hypothetical protein